MGEDQPLAGKLVLDLSQGIAAPYCGRLLAEHGARVIKVEPPEGDWIRQIGDGPGGVSVNFLYYNLGKESIELDLKSEAGIKAALALAGQADVVLESARPGVMDRLGIGFEAVRERNPEIVYLSVSGFGLTGPRARDPMTDTVAQAWSGMMSINRGLNDGRTLATSEEIETWSLTSLRERSIKTGTRLARHGRYAIFQMAAAALPREVFAGIIRLINTLRGPPASAVSA